MRLKNISPLHKKAATIIRNGPIFLFIIFFFHVQGCSNSRSFVEKLAFEQNHNVAVTAQEEINEILLQLTSPNFFEYTQAARYCLDMGAGAIPILYQHRHLGREVHGTIVPVCLLIIKLIFEEQNTQWVTSELQSPFPEIRAVASTELQRRLSEK